MQEGEREKGFGVVVLFKDGMLEDEVVDGKEKIEDVGRNAIF